MTRILSRAAAQIKVYYHPCLRRATEVVFSLGQTGPPSLALLGSIPHLPDNPSAPQILRQVSGSSSLRHPAQSLELNFLFTVPAWTTGPSRFPQSRHCGVLPFSTLHLSTPISPHPWGEVWLRMRQHPRVYRFSVRSRLTPSSCLTSWLSRQVLLRSCQAAVPLSRTALALHSSWLHSRTVSFSSVETLRRTLVCTLPLSVRLDSFLIRRS